LGPPAPNHPPAGARAPATVSPHQPGATIGYLAAHEPHAPPLRRPSGAATGCCPPACAPCSTILVRSATNWPAWSAPCSPAPAPPGSPFQRHEAVWARPRSYLTGQLAAVGCPVLLLSDDHDQLVPPRVVRTAATRIPPARFTPGRPPRPAPPPPPPPAGRRPADRVPGRQHPGRPLTAPPRFSTSPDPAG